MPTYTIKYTLPDSLDPIKIHATTLYLKGVGVNQHDKIRQSIEKYLQAQGTCHIKEISTQYSVQKPSGKKRYR